MRFMADVCVRDARASSLYASKFNCLQMKLATTTTAVVRDATHTHTCAWARYHISESPINAMTTERKRHSSAQMNFPASTEGTSIFGIDKMIAISTILITHPFGGVMPTHASTQHLCWVIFISSDFTIIIFQPVPVQTTDKTTE